jgi:GNAT superfamily N-acetyltransferase
MMTMSGDDDFDYVIERATFEDLLLLPAIEARATERFDPDWLPPDLPLRTLPAEELRPAQAEGRIFVARERDGRVMGFVLVESLDGEAVLEEIDVEPRDGRRGIGTRLVAAACDWARAAGFARIVLSTFREVRWNAPFYESLGFREIPRAEWTPALVEMRESEVRLGFDLEDRILMACALDVR